MAPTAFAALVTRIEDEARTHPRRYSARLLAVASLGYAYIAGVLLGLITLLVLMLLVFLVFQPERWSFFGFGLHWVIQGLMFGVLATMFYTVRGLFRRTPAPSGRRITAKEAPALFAAIDEARKAARGPRIHRALLTDDFNAAVIQRPLFGPFGWYRNTLMIGLPLLDGLSPDEMRAVLAHEIGHLSRGHSRFAGRIFAVRQTWGALIDGLSERFIFILFSHFVKVYAPYFEAYTLVLARAQEREADRLAADLAGGRALADALIKLRILDAHLDATFRPALARQADDSPEPPAAFFDDLRAALGEGLEAADAELRLTAALAETPDVTDTHPRLADRLAALDEAPRVPPAANETAAERLLGESLPALRAEMNRSWQEDARLVWEVRRAVTQAEIDRIAELDAQAADRPLTFREQWERAHLIESAHGPAWAAPLFRRLGQRLPNSPRLLLGQARALLAIGDDSGLEMVRRAAQSSPLNAEEGLALAEQYLLERARLTELAEFRSWLKPVIDKLQAGAEETVSDWKPDDTYLPHGLSEAELGALMELLEACPDLETAYLTRWIWPVFPEATHYFLVVNPTRSAGKKHTTMDAVITHLYMAPEFPGKLGILYSRDGNLEVEATVRAVEGALIYRRDAGQQAAGQRSDLAA